MSESDKIDRLLEGMKPELLKLLLPLVPNPITNTQELLEAATRFNRAEEVAENAKLLSPQSNYAEQIADLSQMVKNLQIKLDQKEAKTPPSEEKQPNYYYQEQEYRMPYRHYQEPEYRIPYRHYPEPEYRMPHRYYPEPEYRMPHRYHPEPDYRMPHRYHPELEHGHPTQYQPDRGYRQAKRYEPDPEYRRNNRPPSGPPAIQYEKTNTPNHRASQASRTTDGKPICNKCKKTGHIARFCPQQKNYTDAVHVQALHVADSTKRRIDIIINKKPAQGLIDTGADISVVSEKFAKNFPEDRCPWNGPSVKLANGSVIKPKFKLKIEVLLKDKKAQSTALIMKIPKSDMLIGNDILDQLGDTWIKLLENPIEEATPQKVNLLPQQNVVIPAKSSARVEVDTEPNMEIEN